MSKKSKKIMSTLAAMLVLPTLAFAPLVSAEASTVVVTPSDSQGWSEADTRTGGDVNFISDNTSPLPDDALELTTDATTTAKAQYMHAGDNSLVSEITDLSYATKQVSGPEFAAASYQLVVDLNGGTLEDGGFATLVYEPYQNGTVTNGDWQLWDVDAGQFWSTRTHTDGDCSTVNGAGGAPFYTLAGLETNCPNATVIGYGVNIGSNNPSYVVETDAFVFNETTYNFEQDQVLTSKEACKNNGWMTSDVPTFKNQGDCVSHFASQGKAKGNPVVSFFRNLL